MRRRKSADAPVDPAGAAAISRGSVKCSGDGDDHLDHYATDTIQTLERRCAPASNRPNGRAR